ncbi:hypothetical protein AQUCO_01700062v1 [Aquilegia coerulea]|uniref:Interferon-related developmental regulator N-terminal domain-containing protein n=2 Tax=Aquilegia coerulea TaxID=218851 RepID=A0A2G5DL22_AQUCA|nr:hypothetical protein AQUCO_01700062v1 [Aquilegia coerulea]
MGKRSNQRKNVALFDSDDEGSVSSSSTAMSELTVTPETEELYAGDKGLDQCLDALFEKRGSTREKALSLLIDGFANKLQHQFVENKCITLLNQCHNSIKRGSSKEINLASRVIGMLAITVGYEDTAAHEVLEESIVPFSQALKSGSDSLKISSILDCLAVITFVGGSDTEATERSMQIIWQFVNPKLGSNVVASKPNTTILTAAISAWTFLLTTMDGCNLNSKTWQESISYLSNLLDKDDRMLRIAAGEALAVIFEVGNLEKILDEAKGSSDSSMREKVIHLQGLKGKILNQVRNLSAEAGGKGLAKKDLNSQKNLFREILEFLEDGYGPETTIKIGADVLSIATWSQLIQVNFLKRFLGGGFVKHMQENIFLQDVFDFTPKKKNIANSDLYLSGTEKRMFKSPNSALNKARTQSLNKKRMMSQGRNTGHYSVSAGDEDV